MVYTAPPSEPIAIIGSSCRFAGGATSPSRLWKILSAPSDLSQEVPPTRFNARAFYHPDGEYHGTTNSIKAYWLEQDHRKFDAAFFNITPREAEALDPQHRMTLEVVYEALESAGYSLGRCSGKNISVLAGLMTADFDTLSSRDELTASQYSATGNARSMISNRVSYFFSFQGPSMTIDTACSSSLVALHLAVSSLRSGESEMACVTGANLLLTPEQFIAEASLHMLSPTGKCRMWDSNADGYARGEGVAAIFLKPLSKAIADGDEIDAVIRETGVNSDGRTQGITMPNSAAQTALIKETYRRAGLDPQNPEHRCQFFEAHGTGTQVGDPREASAIYQAFFGDIAPAVEITKTGATSADDGNHPTGIEAKGHDTDQQELLVGSVKTILGHTEGAAGLAGLLKVILAMKHWKVPPNLHLDRLNPTIAPFFTHLRVPTAIEPWPRVPRGQSLRASVNSFGFGGTNAHVIVELFDSGIHAKDDIVPTSGRADSPTQSHQKSPHVPLLLSGSSRRSLNSNINNLKGFLLEHPEINLAHLALKLASRTTFTYRLSISAATAPEAIEAMNHCLETDSEHIGTRAVSIEGQPRVLAIFTGQGAQWPTMSRNLFLSSQGYRSSIRKMDDILRACRDPPTWSLEEHIFAEKGESRIHEAAISQPLCTALQIGLVDVLRDLGLPLESVVGHSSGEIAAAYAAGRLDMRDSIIVSYYRGKYACLAEGSNGEHGSMLAAGLSSDEARDLCNVPDYKGKIVVAANNSPSSVTLSGNSSAISDLISLLAKEGKFARKLVVETAYHSPHMEKPAEAYTEALHASGIQSSPSDGSISWYSSVEGYGDMDDQPLGITYWRDNMTHCVQFRDALEATITKEQPFDIVLEIGPHPALKGPSMQTMKPLLKRFPSYIGLLDRNKDDSMAFSESLGALWCALGPNVVDFTKFIRACSGQDLSRHRIPDLPSYAWDHSHIHYREPRLSRQYHSRTEPPHELLGVRTRDDNEHELRWRNVLKLTKVPWLNHHRFQGQALVPASAYCVMALDAARAYLKSMGQEASSIQLRNLVIVSGIGLDESPTGMEILFSLQIHPHGPSDADIDANFTLTSCPADGSVNPKMNMYGDMQIMLGAPTPDLLPRRNIVDSETLPATPEAFYKMMDATGLVYSGPFRSLKLIERRFNYSRATLGRHHPEDTTKLCVSPATLDSCLQPAFLSYSFPGDRSLWTSFLPVSIDSMTFNMAFCSQSKGPRSANLQVDAFCTRVACPSTGQKTTITVDIAISNEENNTEIQIEGVSVSAFSNTRPNDDHELYLTTVLDVDPEDEIIQPSIWECDDVDLVQVEECARVTRFMLQTASADLPQRFLLPTTLAKIKEIVPGNPHLVQVLPDIPTRESDTHHSHRHVTRVVNQILHKFPRTRILDMCDPQSGLTYHLISSIDLKSGTYTIASQKGSTRASDAPAANSNLHHVEVIDLDLEDYTPIQEHARPLFDLVLLSTSILREGSASKRLQRVRSMMKASGFLILIEVASVSPRDAAIEMAETSLSEDLLAPSVWPDVLEATGFAQMAKHSNQVINGAASIFVRQALDPHTDIIQFTSQFPREKTIDHLLIIGGIQDKTRSLVNELQELMYSSCSNITICPAFDEHQPNDINQCTAVIVMGDVDDSIISNMTENTIQQLNELLRPNMKALWVTCGARHANPDQAASFGFTRTIAAEVPNLIIYNLDLETLDNSSCRFIADTFTNLINDDGCSHWHRGNQLHVSEREVFIEQGRRMISRVLPFKPGNDRANSTRRIVSETVNSASQNVGVFWNAQGSGFEIRVLENPLSKIIISNDRIIQVAYSTSSRVILANDCNAYLCVGHDSRTGEAVIASSERNSSYISVPRTRTFHIFDGISTMELLSRVVRYSAVAALVKRARGRPLVLLGPDSEIINCSQQIEKTQISVITDGNKIKDSPPGVRVLRVHPKALASTIKAQLSWAKGLVVSLLRLDDPFAHTIRQCLPENCEFISYHDFNSLGGDFGPEEQSTAYFTLAGLVHTAMTEPADSNATHECLQKNTISLSSLLSDRTLISPFTIIDWKAERPISKILKPIAEPNFLQPDRTYVLIGLTRDMGQSLSRFFFDHGARYIVLASRNPNMSPKWKEELISNFGAEIVIEKLDVTNLAEVQGFEAKLSKTIPPVAGVINGAMVLDDRVFSQMTAETWHRVLRPKTIGSKNLDIVFSGPDLQFFIMTSSFAATGGHPGQSNYAAANMYMNGLAANRRARGLPGSVLNIGVIYGLGFLLREKQDLYGRLEREGYPPISERDLHHMFHEAILAGRPDVPNQPYDLTTGLSRFSPDSPDLLFWQRDPRFCHFIRDVGSDESAEAAETQKSLQEQISALDSPPAIADVIATFFVAKLENLLLLPVGSVSKDQNMTGLGVDSLIVVELRNWFYKVLEQDVGALKILGARSIHHLCLDIAEKMNEPSNSTVEDV
ncbi:beta-ketoacyl synthase domain-containing protein [Clohesyomyces aquaticus]|uniref:Beta-ketoacyl synthase domain-containing protein n=1 Tax=Clohesyomyces aquaticus TaxID=1231657 RepID=A0A1Y1Z387_9PLEO|nr:beta-ketoacyl synthase domain-containing protein [Clohesyomyces aquaticus]